MTTRTLHQWARQGKDAGVLDELIQAAKMRCFEEWQNTPAEEQEHLRWRYAGRLEQLQEIMNFASKD